MDLKFVVFSVMRPSIRNYFERKKNTLNNDNNSIPQNGIGRIKKKHVSVNRILKKCKEQYQRKTPEQMERMRQAARKAYFLRKLESILPPENYENAVTSRGWEQPDAEERKLAAIERDRMREQRRDSRYHNRISSSKKTRLPRSLMNPDDLKVARKKAREAQRIKRAGLTEEQREAERQKGRERMRQRRATMSEEEKQVFREIGKERMRLKRASLNSEQKQEVRMKEQQRMQNKWASLTPEEQEAQRQRRRGKSRKRWASLTPEEREVKLAIKREIDRRFAIEQMRSKNKEPAVIPKKDPAPQICQRPKDMLSKLSTANAQLLVVEEAQPLQSADPGHVDTPSLSINNLQCDDPLVEERTVLAINDEQTPVDQLEASMNMECNDELVKDDTSCDKLTCSDQSLQHYETIIIDQACICIPVVHPPEVRWQFKRSFTTLRTGQS